MSRRKQFRDNVLIANVAERLSSICREKNISHEILSVRTGFDTRQIGRILRGESNFSISHFAKICSGLGVYPAEVLAKIDFPINEKYIPPVNKK